MITTMLKSIYSRAGRLVPGGRLRTRLRDLMLRTVFLRTSSRAVTKPLAEGVEGRFATLTFQAEEDFRREIRGYQRHYTLREGDVVVDGGPYTGHYAVYAAKLVGPRGLVVAFEPDPYVVKILRRNVELNGLRNVVIVNRGLWHSTQRLSFESRGLMSRVLEGGAAENAIKTVEVVSLDEECAMRGLVPQFVKMDIEGAEISAVEGCRRLMAQSAVQFAIASYHVIDGRRAAEMLEAWFPQFGYAAKTEFPEHLTTYARPIVRS